VYPFIDSPAKIRINPRTRDTAGKKSVAAQCRTTPRHTDNRLAIRALSAATASIPASHQSISFGRGIRASHSGMAFGHGTKKAAHLFMVRGSHYHAEIIPTVSAPRTLRMGRFCSRPEQNAGIISAVLYAPAD